MDGQRQHDEEILLRRGGAGGDAGGEPDFGSLQAETSEVYC
jgi:hypothetical protein